MQLTPSQVTRNLHMLAPASRQRMEELQEIAHKAIARFQGQFDELEAALGVLQLGDHLGWKPLVLIHNKRTLRKYEDILGIKVREFFPSEGPSSQRSLGYRLAKKIGNFWKAVSGEIQNDELKAHRRVIE